MKAKILQLAYVTQATSVENKEDIGAAQWNKIINI